MNNDYGIGNKNAFVNSAKNAGIKILRRFPCNLMEKISAPKYSRLRA